MSLHFDITGDNSNLLRKLEETRRGVSEAVKFMEGQGRKIDSSLNSVGFGDTLKKQIYEGSQSINGLTAQIISQRKTVRDLTQDINTLNEAYKKAGKGTDKGKELFSDLTQAKNTLAKEKDALFDLQTQQAQARLSVRKLKDEYSLYQKGSQDVIESNNNMSLSFKKTLAAVGGTAMIQKFISDVIKVRGEFQQLDVAFTTLLQSKEKANTLMAQMVETAAKTPFNLTELATGAKQLVAYGFASEEVNDTLIRLGNIASGLGLPIERLTYLYGTTMTQGRLYARDLMQFTTSGIPMLQGLADMYGVSTDKVNEMVTAGKIGFPEVQKVIENLTNEGGKFFNLMEEQSKTITGKISNLGDAWDTMLNKVGESQEGVINNSIDGLKYLVENYEQVGKILTGLALTYGSYKAATIAYYAISKTYGIYDIATKELQFAATMKNVVATKYLAVQQAILNKTMLANPYILATTLIVGAAAAIWTLADHTSAAEKTAKSAAKSMENMADTSNKLKNKINELLATIRDETATQYDKASAYLKLQKIMPDVFKNMDIEKLKLMDELSLREKINEAANISNIVEAKTNMVISQRKYDTASAKYKKDTDNGLVGAGSLAEKNESFMELEAAKKVVSEIEKIQSEANKQKGKEGKKVVVENKEFWEKQKKDAETALDSIASSQKKLMDDGKFDGIDSNVVANYKNQSKLLKEAKKELKVYDTTGKYDKQQESAVEKLRKQNEKYKLLMDKQSLDQSRSAEDLQTQVDQARINAMDEGSKKTLAQMELNFEKEMQAIDRQKEDLLRKKVEDERVKFDKKEDENAAKDPKHKKQTFNPTGIVLSDGENKQFDELYKAQIAEKEKEEKAYLDNLLEKHKDYTGKRLAIEKKFNADISALDEQRKEAVKNGDTKQVEQIDRAKAQATTNKGKELMSMDYDKLKESPEYVRAFENLKETSSETLNSLLSQLENAKTAAAKVLSPDQLREYTTTIQEIMNELDERNPWQALSDKKQELADAEQELAQAQIELENARQTVEAVKGGAKIESGVSSSKYSPKTGKIDSSKAYLTEAQALDKVKEKTDNYNKSKDKVAEKSAKVKKSEKDVTDQIDELSKAISDVGNSIGGPAGEIISLIGDIGSFTMFAMEGIKAAADTSANAISQVEKASVILAIISAAMQIAMKIASLFKGEDEEEKRKKYIEQLNGVVDIYDKIIEKQKESIKFGYGFSAIESAKKAMEELNKQTEVYRKIAYESGRGQMSFSQYDTWITAAREMGIEIPKEELGTLRTMSRLTGEQLSIIRDKYKDFWASLPEEQRNAFQAIIDAGEKGKDIINEWQEAITGISYDSFYDEFIDTLSDMDSSAADMAENFGEYLRKSILAAMVAKNFQKDISSLYEMWVAAAGDKSDGGIDITKDESDTIQQKYKELVEAMTAARDNMANDFGWTSDSSSSQDSTNGGFETMSQDEGKELNGRLTAFQISNEEIRNQSILQSQSLSLLTFKADALLTVNTEVRNIADETRTILANSYLELVQISENTSESAKYLKDIKSDISDVKRNTSRI